MLTHEANAIAIGDCAKAIRDALIRLGMQRCSLQTVYNQCLARLLRLDWYGTFWRWFEALWMAHRPGAEFLFEDFRARVLALRARDDTTATTDWYAQVAVCAHEHSEALEAAILNRDAAAIRRELAESIAAQRRLLAALEARAHGEAHSRTANFGIDIVAAHQGGRKWQPSAGRAGNP